MNWPAVECPYSALNWLVSSVNSPTASGMMYCTGPVTDTSLLSTPSTTKLLFRGRLPPMAPPTPATPPDWLVVPTCNMDRINVLPDKTGSRISEAPRAPQQGPSSAHALCTKRHLAVTSIGIAI